MEDKLEEIIDSYYEGKTQLDKLKKETEQYNQDIKDNLNALGINQFTTKSGLVTKMIKSTRETFNEPALIERLIEIKAEEAIDLVPTINWDKIEDMIYNGRLDAKELAPYKQETEIVSLRISKSKGE